MQGRKLIRFFIVYSIIGLIGSYIIVTLFPALLDKSGSQVKIKQVQLPVVGSVNASGPVSYADAVAAAAPGVVNIHTTKLVTQRINPFFDDPRFRQFFGDMFKPRQRVENSLGSGVIISDDGYLLTNYHVIKDADGILVALNDGRTAEATVVGTDPETDLAVLQITLDNLHSVVLGESESLRVGDVVLAIGNPFGVGQTVTLGIVSAKGRSQLGINTFENFIQTDAAINPGNSGGALINAKGYLIGINTAIFSKSGASHGIGFAIPTRVVKDVLESIVENGKVSRGWIGVETQNLTRNLAESFGLKNSLGVVVTGIYRNSPAKKSGILPGDVLISLSGEKVLDGQSWKSLVLQLKVSSKVLIGLIRKGITHEVELVLAKRPEDFN